MNQATQSRFFKPNEQSEGYENEDRPREITNPKTYRYSQNNDFYSYTENHNTNSQNLRSNNFMLCNSHFMQPDLINYDNYVQADNQNYYLYNHGDNSSFTNFRNNDFWMDINQKRRSAHLFNV